MTALHILDQPFRPGTPTPGGSSQRGPSRIRTALLCEFLWALRYYSKWRPKHDKPHRLIGSLFHLHMAYHSAAQLDDPPDWFRNIPLQDALLALGRGQPQALEAAEGMAAFCISKFGDFGWQILGVEIELWSPVEMDDAIDPSKLAGQVVTARADLACAANDLAFGVDLKTKSAASKSGRLPPFHANDVDYTHSLQFATITRLVRKRWPNMRVPGFYVVRQTQKTPYDADRNLVVLTDEIYAQAAKLLAHGVVREQEIVARIRSGLPVLKTGIANGACSNYGGCDYAEVCAASKSEARAILEVNFTKRDPTIMDKES